MTIDIGLLNTQEAFVILFNKFLLEKQVKLFCGTWKPFCVTWKQFCMT